MAIDVLRSCYRSQMRMDRSRPDLLVEGEWFFCPPGYEVCPYPTAFGSRNYTEPREEADLSLGEVEVTKRWIRGECPPGVTGKFFCGDPSHAANGVDLVNGPIVPLDPTDGVLLCCRGGVPIEDELRDINYWRQVAGGALDVYYGGGSVTGQNNFVFQPAVSDEIQALPLLASRGGTLDRIALYLDTAGSVGSTVRLAIYEAESETDLTPARLVVDSGDIATDASSGVWVWAPINVTLDKLKLYWLCVNANAQSIMPLVGALGSQFYYNLLGFDTNSFQQNFGFKVAFPYAAYPLTFPAVVQADMARGFIEMAGVRYSA